MTTAKVLIMFRLKDSKFKHFRKGCCLYKVISEDYILGGFYVGYSRRMKRYKAARNFIFKTFYI